MAEAHGNSMRYDLESDRFSLVGSEIRLGHLRTFEAASTAARRLAGGIKAPQSGAQRATEKGAKLPSHRTRERRPEVRRRCSSEFFEDAQ